MLVFNYWIGTTILLIIESTIGTKSEEYGQFTARYYEIIYRSVSINFCLDAKSCSTSTIDYIIVARLGPKEKEHLNQMVNIVIQTVRDYRV